MDASSSRRVLGKRKELHPACAHLSVILGLVVTIFAAMTITLASHFYFEHFVLGVGSDEALELDPHHGSLRGRVQVLERFGTYGNIDGIVRLDYVFAHATDAEFRRDFRVTREMFAHLERVLGPALDPQPRSFRRDTSSARLKIAMALHYLGHTAEAYGTAKYFDKGDSTVAEAVTLVRVFITVLDAI